MVTDAPVVLITRPEEVTGSLEAKLASFGIGAVTYSPLKIVRCEPDDWHWEITPRDLDLVIFVSPISVQIGFETISKFIGGAPRKQIIAAVGRSTASVLKSLGVSRVIVPNDGSGAEALVDSLAMHHALSDKNILIVHGEGGGENIASGLAGKVKKLIRFVCYRSEPNSGPVSNVMQMFNDKVISCWTATSRGIFTRMLSLGSEYGVDLASVPVFVNHNRIASDAVEAGTKTVIYCKNATGEMARCISEWFKAGELG